MNQEIDVKDQLIVSISNQIEELEGMKVGSDEYKITVDGISKLWDKLNESNKNDYDYLSADEARKLEKELKESQLAQETELKKQQLAEDRMDHWIKNGLTALSVVGGFVIAVWGTRTTLKFEETGSVTTMAGREFINSLFRRKH